MLHDIIAHKEKFLAAIDLDKEIAQMESRLDTYPVIRGLRSALQAESEIAIIAEIKKQSPSKGILNNNLNIEKLAMQYESAGARAISVLTEERYFAGSIDDLIAVRQCTGIPILRKDFMLHEYQIWQSRAVGADAILLITAILSDEKLTALYKLARQIGLEVIIEVHSKDEIEKALALNPEIIGVNNRNLKTFETDINNFGQLSPFISDGTVCIAESGIFTRSDILRLKDMGANAVLVGEALVTSANPEDKICELRGANL